MISKKEILFWRMKRQGLLKPVAKDDYDTLFKRMSPVPTEYWCEPGNPPSLPAHVSFDDKLYNSERRAQRAILKGRFAGGSIAYVQENDLELFACLYKKPLGRLTMTHTELLDLLAHEGAMNIGMMKEITGLLVKQITPVLHQLQQVFLVFEDQQDNEGDRGWYLFEREFPDVDLNRCSPIEALQKVMPRFAQLAVFFDEALLKSYYRLPLKLILAAVAALVEEQVLQPVSLDGQAGYMLTKDYENIIDAIPASLPSSTVLLQCNDFLVRAFADSLKKQFHSDWGALYYLLIDGSIRGVVTGHFKFGPHIIEDVVLDLPEAEIASRRTEIESAIYRVFDVDLSPILRFAGKLQ